MGTADGFGAFREHVVLAIVAPSFPFPLLFRANITRLTNERERKRDNLCTDQGVDQGGILPGCIQQPLYCHPLLREGLWSPPSDGRGSPGLAYGGICNCNERISTILSI